MFMIELETPLVSDRSCTAWVSKPIQRGRFAEMVEFRQARILREFHGDAPIK
jgi:hypothetical protein